MDEASELEGARTRARDLVDDLRRELAGIIAGQEADVPDDEHDVEGASIAFERARVTTLLRMAETRLAAVEAAATRAGAEPISCDDCGAPIDEERLTAVPGTSKCVDCAKAAESTRLRQQGGLRPPHR